MIQEKLIKALIGAGWQEERRTDSSVYMTRRVDNIQLTETRLLHSGQAEHTVDTRAMGLNDLMLVLHLLGIVDVSEQIEKKDDSVMCMKHRRELERYRFREMKDVLPEQRRRRLTGPQSLAI